MNKMKKSVKITIAIIACVMLVASIALNVVLGIKCGIIKKASFLSGSVDESWRKNDANIAYDPKKLTPDGGKYYSNYNGDYIDCIRFDCGNNNDYGIGYNTDFNITDDLEVYFVLECNGNRFTTPVEKSHSPLGGDYIEFYCDFQPESTRIVEVWVRTID